MRRDANQASVPPALRFDARVKLVCLVLYFIAALHARTPVALGACAVVAAALAVAARLSPRSIAMTIRPLAVILVFTVFMQVVYVQQGAVLAQVGPIVITQGTLETAGAMVVGLVCVMVASVSFMRCTPTDELVATFNWMLAPLRAVGVRTGSFMLALTVAFRFVPVFADEFGQLKRVQLARHASFDGKVRDRLAAYTRLFPPLVRSSFRRADRLAEAFVARCFTGASHATLHPQRTRVRDLLLAIAAAILLVITFVL